MKVCSKCKVLQSMDQFSKDNSRKTGLNPWCRSCKTRASSDYRKNNHIKRLAYERNWELQNQEKRRQQKACVEQKTQTREYRKSWRRENPDKNRAYCMNYYTGKMMRMPKWLSDKQKCEIAQFYADADYLTHYTQTPFEVDHIIPLQGKLVSGLHVPWNLQLLTKSENCKKGNR